MHGQRTEKPESKASAAPADLQRGATGDNRSSWWALTRHGSPEPCNDPGDRADLVKYNQEKNPSDALRIGGVPHGVGQRERGEATHSPHGHLHDYSCMLAGRMLPVPRQSLTPHSSV